MRILFDNGTPRGVANALAGHTVDKSRSKGCWGGGMNNDHVVRVNTKTGEATEYLLPRATNIRRVNVDDRTNPPTFWVGNNLGASLIKVEPVE